MPSAEVVRLVRIPGAAVDREQEARGPGRCRAPTRRPARRSARWNSTMWTTPSVTSSLARWLPSRTSSTMSGWSDEGCADLLRPGPAIGPARSTQTLASGWRRNAGRPLERLGAARLAERVADHRATRGSPGAAGVVDVACRRERPARRRGASLRVSGGLWLGASVAIGCRASGLGRAGAADSSASIRGRPPSTRDGGIATAVTAAATRNSPTMIRAASRDAHVSSASTTSGSRSGRSRSSSGMNWR